MAPTQPQIRDGFASLVARAAGNGGARWTAACILSA